MPHPLVIVLLVFVLAVTILLPPALIIALAIRNRRKREQIYCELSQRMPTGTPQAFVIRARYASEPRFRKFWKIFPWEGAGLLHVGEECVFFSGRTLAGDEIDFRLGRPTTEVAYVGRRWWPNGALSWLRICAEDSIHYLSSETGDLVIGSARTTEQIVRLVEQKEVLARPAGALSAMLLGTAWLYRAIQVVLDGRTHIVEYDGRGMGYESVWVDGLLAARQRCWSWFVPRFEFQVQTHPAVLCVAVSPWLTLSRLNLSVEGRELYAEGERRV